MPRRAKLRLKSLYALYQRLFGYTSTASPEQRKNFAIAIGATNRTISQVFTTRSIDVIKAYKDQKHHPQAEKFLDNFAQLLSQHPTALNTWRFVDSEISLPGRLFPNASRDGMIIPMVYLYNPSGREVLIPTFGTPKQGVEVELGALLVLLEQGTISPPLPPFLSQVTYWDLTTANEYSVSVASISPPDANAVLQACFSLMEE